MKKYKEFINESKKITEDPLIKSAKRGGSTTVKIYLKSGDYDINVRDNFNRTPLMWSCLNKFLIVTKILVNAGADVNLFDNEHRTALMMSSTPKTIKFLLENNADVNIINSNGDTVAMEWIRFYKDNNQELFLKYLKMFIEHGLNLDVVNNKGQNFYEKMRSEFSQDNVVQEYMDENYSQYKEEYDLKQNINKFNL